MKCLDDLYVRIGDLDRNRDYLGQLSEQVGVGITPFVGAGLSVPVGFPMWRDFLERHAREAGIATPVLDLLRNDDYERAASQVCDAMGATGFHEAIRLEYSASRLPRKRLRGAIAWLPKLCSGPVITTNFDGALEKAFADANQEFEDIVYGADPERTSESFNLQRRVLLKVHGDYKSTKDRILTYEEFQHFYGGDVANPVDMALNLPMALEYVYKRPLLFVGCSLNQDRTLAVLRKVAATSVRLPLYAIVEYPTSEVEFRNRKRFLEDRHIQAIWYPVGQHNIVELILKCLAKAASRTSRKTPPSKPLRKSTRYLPVPLMYANDSRLDWDGRSLNVMYTEPPTAAQIAGKVPFAIQDARIALAPIADGRAWPVNLQPPLRGVRKVHILINAGDGRQSHIDENRHHIGSVRLKYEDGGVADHVTPIILGQNVREWAIGNSVFKPNGEPGPDPLVRTVSDTTHSKEVWKGATTHGQVAVMDRLTIDIPAEYRNKLLLAIDFVRDIRSGTIALDYNIFGITMELYD